MNNNDYTPAARPTFYFIGVTTGSSSIMKVFPKWAAELGLDAEMKGFDFVPHSPAEDYREVVSYIKNDPNSLGALVTTHKIDLYNAAKDLFDYLDPYAVKLGEISSISKDGDKLCGHAKDPISSGKALQNFVPDGFFREHGGEVLLLGAGGSSLAMSIYLTDKALHDAADIPKKITIANRSQKRLDSAKELLADVPQMNYVLSPTPADNDATLAQLPAYSLIVNATGLGKDAPGSPLTDAAVFPANSLVWEINYRGDLIFKEQALRQAEEKNLHVEGGWIYFIHGWTQVMEEVFHIDLSDKIERLSEIASS